MAEQLNLTVPIAPPSITSWKVERLVLDKGQTAALAEIVVLLRGPNSESSVARYDGDTARTFIVALNKMNLSTTSLERRILERLVADGKLSGTVTGTPD